MGACGAIDVVAFPGVALPNPQRRGVVESHPSASLRAGSFAKCAKDGPPSFVVGPADSRFLDSARSSALRMIFLHSHDKILRGLAARLRAWPSREWRFPNP
jgi:hypothetical protein